MTLTVKPYDLPDIQVLNSTDPLCVLIWHPDRSIAVLGQSNHVEGSLKTEQVLLDGIDVYKRPSGGEAVVLTQNTLIISLAFTPDHFQNPQLYFLNINQHIIEALKSLGVKDIFYKGISDIAIGDRKILGSSIYRRKDRVFYHAVLNTSESAETIDKYILHPGREPDYRKGREHAEFVTSLAEQGYDLSFALIKEQIEKQLMELNFNHYE